MSLFNMSILCAGNAGKAEDTIKGIAQGPFLGNVAMIWG